MKKLKEMKHFKKIVAVVMAGILAISAIIIFPIGREDGEGILEPTEVFASERMFGAVEPLASRADIATLSIGEILEGQVPREGYILAPTMFGLAGIDTASSFVLRTPVNYAGEPRIFIDGQVPPIITRENENTFIVTPAIPFTPNSVYVFRLFLEGGAEISWAFQTALRFEITGTLPRNQSTNVPVRTGIEINFSHGEEIDISENFSIYPHVEGRFIHRGSTTIFTPSAPLEHSTVYTVTIASGITHENNVITTDRVFSFETAPEQQASTRPLRNSRIHFSHSYVEFPTFAAPSVNFWLNYDNRTGRPSIEMNLYRIENRAAAITAVNRLVGAHGWSNFSAGDFLIDTSGLENIFTRVITERQQDERRWNESFVFPSDLPAGFYVLDAKVGTEGSRQVIVQITDLSVQVIADEEKALVWVNDMNAGRAVTASVFDPISNRTYETTAYGIAVVERELSAGEYMLVSVGDTESVVFVHSSGFQHFHQFWGGWDYDVEYYDMPVTRSWGGWHPWGMQNANNLYWTALQLDRTLFQRADTVSLWGFVQNRRTDEEITFVTAVLTESSWWRWDSSGSDTLHRQQIAVAYGAYTDEIRLPNLDPGSYEIAIYHGDVLLNSVFFTVMDYVKPPYQLTVSASHAAIFAGEDVTFTARTEFFEGTPVPDLDISYNMWGWELNTGGRNNERGRETTNLDGIVEFSARPTAQGADVQGQRTLQFAAEATLPEIGWVHEQASVRVFVNDINVRPRASREGRNATLSVNVHNITLDRLNNGTSAHWGDFLCEPRASQTLSVEIVEHWWEQRPDGEYYCHVTRQTVTRYRYVPRQNSLERFDITTNAEGFAERNFTVPDTDRRSYEARITTRDGNGRTIRHNVFIGRNWDSFFNNANNDRLFLDGANPEGYDIGDAVELTIMRGTEPLAQGNYLFVIVQGGILSYHVGTNPLAFTFGEQHVPNAQVFAYHYNGHVYNTAGSQRLRYNPEHRNLVISITTCQAEYRPGETPTFIITTTDENGNPKPANVNISLVDEALFALMDYNVDTLEMLYRNINDSLSFSLRTHRTFHSSGDDDWGGTDDSLAEEGESLNFVARANNDMAPAAAAAEPQAGGGDGGGDSTRIRERFEDTAIFASVRTNANGSATLTFPLPDNVTSWRVTASAISNDLYAGNTVQNVRVTLPMFLHYTLNRTFLTGDIPTLGVNAYGTALAGGEAVSFSVWREDFPNDIRRATGVAFERVNIPLWEMSEEGHGAIVIRAEVAGFSDAVRHEYQIVNSHRNVDTAIFYDEVTPQTVFAINQGGLTNITFTDRGRGQFLSDLFGLRYTWHSGARVEGLVARREAGALIREHFPDVRMFGDSGSFDILDYQTQNGGIAILPYSEAELEVTVKILPFIRDEINLISMRNYLQGIYASSATDNKMLALYGLAMLGEPVLFELRRYAMLDNLSVRNYAYIALGFEAIGDTQAARDIYNERIAPHIQNIAPLYRVNAGTNRMEILDATSVAALLASRLGLPEAIGLHNYATSHRFAAIQPRVDNQRDTVALNAMLLLNLERLNFISSEIENYTDAEASITYTLFGETVTRELRRGGSFTLRIPAQSFREFNLISTTGEVGAVSIVRTPLEEMNTVENDLTITREFFRGETNERATTFAQDELVRVQITVNYSARDLAGTYQITDFLPAGLTHVANSARFSPRDNRAHGWHAWVTTEGQRITFHDHNGRFDRSHTYFYYARVINPGTFRAEGTIVQSLGAREYMVVGDDAVLTIR
jgi:hypothetical protein